METRRARCRIVFGIFLIGLMAVSLYPRLHTPFVPSGGDKPIHFMMYFILAVPAVLGWPNRRILLLLALPVLGFALELAQMPIPGRFFEWGDALANTLGAFAGVAVVSIIATFMAAWST